MGETYWKLQTMANYFHPNTSFSSSLWEACLWINYKKGEINLLFSLVGLCFYFVSNSQACNCGTVKLPILPLRLCTIWDLRRICKVHQHLLRIFLLGKNSTKAEHFKAEKYSWSYNSQKTTIPFPFKSVVDIFFLFLIPWLLNCSYSIL